MKKEAIDSEARSNQTKLSDSGVLNRLKNKYFIGAAAAQLAVIIALITVILSVAANPEITEIPLSKWSSKEIEFSDGVWYADSKTVKTDETIRLIQGPYIEEKKGSYLVTIDYDASSEQTATVSAGDDMSVFIKTGTAKLSKALHTVSFQFEAKKTVQKLEIIVNYSGTGSLKIKKITIQKDYAGTGRLLVYLAALFILMDIFYLFYERIRENREVIFALACITLLTSLPLFTNGVNRGNDFLVHILRIEGLADELRRGVFPVRMQSLWLQHYGYPVSVYYGDLLLYIPAVIRLLGFNVIAAYKIYVGIINILTVMIGYLCFKDMFGSRKTALLSTLAYSTASYRLVNVYIRAAVGEYTSMVFFPIIALALYRIYTDTDKSKKRIFTNSLLLSVGMLGLITSHILSTEMAVFVLAALCLALFVFTIKPNVLAALSLAVVETLVVGAGFIVPFFDYYKNVHVKINDTVDNIVRIQSWGCGFAEYFAFFSDPHNDWSIHRSADMSFTPGIVLMGTLFIAIIFVLNNKGNKNNGKLIFCSVFGILTMYVASNVFPWNKIAFDSKIGNLMAQVQFPWRYIGITIIFLTVIFGIIINIGYEKKAGRMGIYAVLIIILSLLSTSLFTGQYLDDSSMRTYYSTADINLNEVSSGEYLRSGSYRSSATGKLSYEGADKVEIIERDGTTMILHCECSKSSAAIEVPIFNYKGYIVTDEEGNSYEITDGKENVIRFEIPKGFNGNVTITFKEPTLWRVSEIITVVSIAVLFVIAVRLNRQKPRKKKS